MKFSDWLTRLAHGPLGDLPIGGDSTGVIPEAQVKRLAGKMQLALTALHTRLPLSIKTLQLSVTSGKFVYPLRADFAQTSASAELDKFIQDSVDDPFTGDVLAIEHVFDSSKVEVGLNDRRDATSWFTPAYDTLSMDYPVTGDIYFVEYRANHAPITVEFLEPAEGENDGLTPATLAQEIRIPPALDDAFMAKVAYEVFCGMTSDVAILKAQELNARYETEMARLENQNSLNTSLVEDRTDAIKAGGWV